MDLQEQKDDVRNKLVFLLLLVGLFIFSFYTIASMSLRPKQAVHQKHFVAQGKLARNLTQSTCKIPELDPFSMEIQPALADYMEPLRCTHYENDKYPLLFNSSIDPYPRLIPIVSKEELAAFNIFNCTYRRLVRKAEKAYLVDENLAMDVTEYSVNLFNETKIPYGHNLIAIACWRSALRSSDNLLQILNSEEDNVKTIQQYMDVHAFPEMEAAKPHYSKKNYNVIILGIDSTSRMNFIRTMPKTRAYLLDKLEALEMTSYHKIGDNTFPNIGPMLTNQIPINESILPCEEDKFYDMCPFIWKDFESCGYKTLFGEDERSLSIFNLGKHGFKLPPTSFYVRPLTIGADMLTGHRKKKFTRFCYGPRPAIQVVLDYMEKVSYLASRKETKHNYFQFFWSTSTTHDYIRGPENIDGPLEEALKWWHQGKYLRNTILIVMSDHGARFGKIHEYYQGLIEDRLPALYIYVPERFKLAHSEEYRNLVNNQNRLMHAVDLHKTLHHILTFRKKNQEHLLPEKNTSEYYSTGISLFNPIPLNRTCREAGIAEAYCTCNHKMVPVSESDGMVMQAANFVVYEINRKFKDLTKCAFLKLERVIRAGIVTFGDDVKGVDIWVGYQIAFETSPGNGRFEALLLHGKDKKWRLSGEVGRSNLYGNDSHCVDDKRLKLYCFCLNITVTDNCCEKVSTPFAEEVEIREKKTIDVEGDEEEEEEEDEE